MPFVRKEEQNWDTTRSVGHTRAVQIGKRRETSAGSRHQLHGRSKEPLSQVGGEDSYTQTLSSKAKEAVGLCRGHGRGERRICIIFF